MTRVKPCKRESEAELPYHEQLSVTRQSAAQHDVAMSPLQTEILPAVSPDDELTSSDDPLNIHRYTHISFRDALMLAVTIVFSKLLSFINIVMPNRSVFVVGWALN